MSRGWEKSLKLNEVVCCSTLCHMTYCMDAPSEEEMELLCLNCRRFHSHDKGPSPTKRNEGNENAAPNFSILEGDRDGQRLRKVTQVQ